MVGENEKKLQHYFGGWQAKPEKRKILRCTATTDPWYKDMIGKVIEIKAYGTFGCVDMQDRWIGFYDLSELIE